MLARTVENRKSAQGIITNEQDNQQVKSVSKVLYGKLSGLKSGYKIKY